MKLLQVVRTPEQLGIVSSQIGGVEIIRGAAGSGKTTTAIMRLNGLIRFFTSRLERMGSTAPVRVLVITFNRTLCGYIDELLADPLRGERVRLEVSTFSKWAFDILNVQAMLDRDTIGARIRELGAGLPISGEDLVQEVEYLLGLYLPAEWHRYIDSPRHGRGASPRIDRALKERILNQVVRPYSDWKRENNLNDWSDLEVRLAQTQSCPPYDIIVADESQDYSANLVRALMLHAAPEHAVTFIADTAQRIYKRAYRASDVGWENARVLRLNVNYRNTKQIAAFAAPLLHGLEDQDATVPDFNACTRQGAVPQIISGLFTQQLEFAINFIRTSVDLAEDSVAFLQPKGGGYFNFTRRKLVEAGLDFVEITRERLWPSGPQNIALSTIASAKGVEFDHVFLLGLNPSNLEHGAGADDDEYQRLRRLLAMGICRARKTVTVGQKPSEHSDLLDLFDPETYTAVAL